MQIYKVSITSNRGPWRGLYHTRGRGARSHKEARGPEKGSISHKREGCQLLPARSHKKARGAGEGFYITQEGGVPGRTRRAGVDLGGAMVQ